MTEPITPPQKAPKVDRGHLLPPDDWDEVQRQVDALQAEDPAYSPNPIKRARAGKTDG